MNHGLGTMLQEKENVLNKTAHIIQGLSFLFFFACLFQDGYYRSNGYPPENSATLLALGVFGLLDGIVAWLANPALLAAWVCFYFKRFNISLWLGILAFILIISFLLHTTIIANEGGTRVEIIGYGLGFWLWLVSSLTTIVAALLGILNVKQNEKLL
jgi:hypothetical protein